MNRLVFRDLHAKLSQVPLVSMNRPFLGPFPYAPCFILVMAIFGFTATPSVHGQISDDNPAPPLLPVPVAILETEEFDWGSLIQGQKVQHSFLIENRGRSPLKILKVTATCGCTRFLALIMLTVFNLKNESCHKYAKSKENSTE